MRSRIKKILLIASSVIAFILLFSCISTEKEKKITRLISEWSGKEILFPKDMYFTMYGKDTIEYPVKHSKYSIVSYIDSTGCTSCKLQPQMWKKYISLLHSATVEVPVFLFMHPKNKEELIGLLKNSYFNHPVCIDEDDTFNRLNHFPSDMAFQTFLLDKDNKVVAVGNPIYNLKLGELYIQIIRDKEKQQDNAEREKVIITKMSTDRNTISLGSFDWQTKQRVVFTLKNMGEYPLVIENVSTSCGCTSASYSQVPVPSGKEIELEVTYKAERPEYFNKTITVYCNVEPSPIILSISGNAK